MKKLLCLFFFCTFAHATDLNLSVGVDHYQLVSKDDDYILLDKSCWEKKENCDAYKALKKMAYSKFKRKEKLDGGKNPSSVFCREAHHGEVLLAKDEKGNTHSLCRLKDKSVVTADSLIYSAKKLDR